MPRPQPSVLWLLLLAAAPGRADGGRGSAPVARTTAQAWCAGAPRPAIGRVASTFTSVGTASIALTPEGEVIFAVAGHASFPIPWHDAHGGSSDTEAATTWLFRLVGEHVETIGEVSRADAVLARGAGTPVFAAGDQLTACTAGGQAPLPASGADRDRPVLTIDGTTLAVARDEPPTEEGPDGVIGGSGGRKLSLATLDTSAPSPAWKSVARREVRPTPGPKGGEGHRVVGVSAAAASASAAAFAVTSCSAGFGGDYYWSRDCSTRVEAWQNNGWTSAPLPLLPDAERDNHAVSVEEGVVRVAVEHDSRTRVYRLERGHLLPEGDELPGWPHALFGRRLVLVTTGGSKRGTNGFGYRLRVHELIEGRWKATSQPLDLDEGGDVAIAWQGQRIVVIAPEAQPLRNPATARIIVGTNGHWRDVGVAKANVSPGGASNK